VKSCSRICLEKRETRLIAWSESATGPECRIEKENKKLGESQNPTQAHEGRFENQEENLKIWVGQNGTGQNLGGGCSRFKGATA